jgi:Holliday junction resolvase RusA-like endonuclease
MGGNAPITVVYDGTPQAKARARFGRGHAYTPQATVDYQHALGWQAKAAMIGRKPFRCAVRVTALFELPTPSSWTTTQRNRAIAGTVKPTTKPDIDNLLKAALDAINGIVVADDAQAVEIIARKVYGVNPKTIVTVAPLSGARL